MAFDESALVCFAPLHTPYIKLTNWPAVGNGGNSRVSNPEIAGHFAHSSTKKLAQPVLEGTIEVVILSI